MKTFTIVIFSLILSVQLFAQEQTLVSGPLESGGYGAPVVKISNINSKTAVLIGGYGGWLINHTFLIGGGGYGLVNNISASQTAQDNYGFSDLRLLLGYGGLVLEYIGENQSLIHYTVSALIGGGGVTYRSAYNMFLNSFYPNNYNASAFFVLEPTVNVEVNITKFFRITGGIGYRYITGTDLVGLKDTDISGPSFSLGFLFGLF